MRIIPVVDLMQNRVVHARQGRREHYQPLHTETFPHSDPFSVIAKLLSLAAFRTLYIADLDCIMGEGDQTSLIDALGEAWPSVKFWVDAGWLPLSGWPGEHGRQVVIGTESLDDSKWDELRGVDPNRFVLSLDCRDGVPMGSQVAWTDETNWPNQVISMQLSRVGSDDGPALEDLSALVARQPTRAIFGAGGVRNRSDLAAMANAGAAGALVASALYAGVLTAEDLQFAGQEPAESLQNVT